MKIKMLKTVPAALDGMHCKDLEADSIVEIIETQPRAVEVAEVLMREGWAESVTDEQAATHLEELGSMSEEERAARAEELRESAARKRAPKKPTGKKPVPPSLPPKLPPAILEAGSVVENAARRGQRMTIERIEGDLAECVWFVEGDPTTPHRDVFVLATLVLAEGK